MECNDRSKHSLKTTNRPINRIESTGLTHNSVSFLAHYNRVRPKLAKLTNSYEIQNDELGGSRRFGAVQSGSRRSKLVKTSLEAISRHVKIFFVRKIMVFHFKGTVPVRFLRFSSDQCRMK